VNENYDIVGLSEQKCPSLSDTYFRLVFKSNNEENQNMHLKVKKSLLRNCLNFDLRTDLAEVGIYICKYWIIKLILGLEEDHK